MVCLVGCRVGLERSKLASHGYPRRPVLPDASKRTCLSAVTEPRLGNSEANDIREGGF